MELSSHDGDMPLPINSAFVGIHGHWHGHEHHPTIAHNSIVSSSGTQVVGIPPTNAPQAIPSPTLPQSLQDRHEHSHISPPPNYKKMVKYRECLKNHAASIGGNATDGCGEFMPSGEDGSIEALSCSVCNCHRNFHRKEVEGEPSSFDYYRLGRKVVLGHHLKNLLAPEALGYSSSAGAFVSSRVLPPQPLQAQHSQQQIIVPYGVGSHLPSESDEKDDGGIGLMGRSHAHHHHLGRKRFRTKFTSEQKEKMLSFAEDVGWKIQKQEEAVVQQFCQEIGVKRRVLKVWMHNNKPNMARKSIDPSSTTAQP